MAIQDYASLVAAIKSYCARNDTTFATRIPDFIEYAEHRLNHGHGESGDGDPLYSPPLRTRVMEAAGIITLTAGAGAIPDDYLAMRKIARPGDRSGLVHLPPERFAIEAMALQGGGTPYYYTIENNEVKVLPTIDGELSISFYKKHPAVSVTVESPLLQEHGLLYLEAALIDAFAWMKEAGVAAGHATKLNGMVKGVNATSASVRNSGVLRAHPRRPIP